MKYFKLALFASLMTVAVSRAHADPPVAILVGVRIWIGSTTLDGYTAYSNYTPQEMKKENPTVDEQFAYVMSLGNFMQFYSDPREVKYPEPMFVSATGPSQMIPRRLISKYERKSMPLDGRNFHGPYNAVPILAIELLNREPLFSCAENDGWGGIRWISYNPEYNSEKMKPLCDDPKSELAAGLRRYIRAAVPDVFELKFHVD